MKFIMRLLFKCFKCKEEKTEQNPQEVEYNEVQSQELDFSFGPDKNSHLAEPVPEAMENKDN